MDNRKRMEAFISFILGMDNVQAERNELRLLVDRKYWRWSTKKLLKKIRKVGSKILKKGSSRQLPEPQAAGLSPVLPITEPSESSANPETVPEEMPDNAPE